MKAMRISVAWMLAIGLVVAATQLGVAKGLHARAAGPSFSYSGNHGPGFWAEIDPAWIDCGQDTRQSPIRLAAVTVDPSLQPLDLDVHDTPIHLINNGHTVEQEYEPGSSITWDGVDYDLLQFHFHTPSEHTAKNTRFVMELHAVFKNAGTGNIVVVGQFYRLGAESAFLDEIDGLLPEKKGEETSSTNEIDVEDAFVDTTSYWTYLGSLTTPPCSPVVTWVVLKTPATMSDQQLRDDFWRIMGNNFRPTQDRNGRVIRSTA